MEEKKLKHEYYHTAYIKRWGVLGLRTVSAIDIKRYVTKRGQFVRFYKCDLINFEFEYQCTSQQLWVWAFSLWSVLNNGIFMR